MTHTLLLVAAVMLAQIPLSGEVFAQQDVATTSQEIPALTPEPAVQQPWYKLEKISGTIDVGDFVVGPGRSEVSLQPGKTATIEISVTNRIDDNRNFEIEIEDIQAADDGKGVVSLPPSERGPYSIVDFISVPETSIPLELGERARIPITITVPPNTPPGGYYGTVLISTVRDAGSTDAAAPRSPVVARIGSIILLTVEGDVVRAGQTLSVDTTNNTRGWYESGPIELGILYENTGSVHVNPYGQVSIKNLLGEEIGFVSLEPWFVLPDSLRLREITWDREWLFGRYTVEAQINRGYDDIVDTVATSFWVLPWKLVGGTFLVIFIIVFSIRAFFRTFEFKRRGQ